MNLSFLERFSRHTLERGGGVKIRPCLDDATNMSLSVG